MLVRTKTAERLVLSTENLDETVRLGSRVSTPIVDIFFEFLKAVQLQHGREKIYSRHSAS